MSYYKYHVFFCTNQREDGAQCCGASGGQVMRDYAKKQIKTLGLNGEGQCRINSAGCMDRCSEGPVLVVYPEGTWYTYVDQQDIDDIIEHHLQGGQVVERLKI
ncbi:ferredoxin [Sulfuriferula sp.]|uniref:(2Fe-2S) ferredoxin domain-containing protein n=1 Tax=Sulfuriferula sp. TaxID=2025307 RepID=UPI00272F1CCF|nr:(2Fe-2S) ferredoxin domain-containing protein [Sulfuriferula sp.]MDP2025323.1 (2Fe-2S) ferredoxin domain-containing protein [Sulfuriferula sp.]